MKSCPSQAGGVNCIFLTQPWQCKCLAVNKGPITQDNTEKNLDYSSAIYCLFRPIFGYSCLDTLICPLNQCIDFIYRVKQKICSDLHTGYRVTQTVIRVTRYKQATSGKLMNSQGWIKEI